MEEHNTLHTDSHMDDLQLAYNTSLVRINRFIGLLDRYLSLSGCVCFKVSSQMKGNYCHIGTNMEKNIK